ncbi:hypothetical protein YE28_07110 [Salmonella enterica subsp. arizonae]|nr:hypothetical protein [Salmonella enterica subsp. arizonae]ECH9223169.1 hypothetical protein [Salmonella enterica subsp. arizonae]
MLRAMRSRIWTSFDVLLKSLTPKQADTVAFVPSWMVISDSHNLQGDIYEASPVGAGAGNHTAGRVCEFRYRTAGAFRPV